MKRIKMVWGNGRKWRLIVVHSQDDKHTVQYAYGQFQSVTIEEAARRFGSAAACVSSMNGHEYWYRDLDETATKKRLVTLIDSARDADYKLLQKWKE